MDKEKQVSEKVYEGLKTEITAGKLMFPPHDEYKKGWNDAMTKALGIVKRYEEGNGLFQL